MVKVLEKARTTLDIYTRLLGKGTFFNGDQCVHANNFSLILFRLIL